MMKPLLPLLVLLMLAGCSTVKPPVVQKTQSARVNPALSLDMEQLCKDSAAL